MHTFQEYVNPFLGDLLQKLKLDKSYIYGKGCYLYDSDGNKYLDCLGAYGALPFGHNPDEIWECIYHFRQSNEPNFILPSFPDAAGELAEKLTETAPEGLKYVTFTNSGAETVEAAIKLCRSSTGRTGILAVKNSFHGKTLAALSATGNNYYQEAFGAPVQGFNFIDYGDTESLQKELESNPDFYAAFIVEPIQGEGGIIVPPDGYLKKIAEICSHFKVKLIFDEIQTGLGRTGSMFACENEAVGPDVLLVAKALGGGIIPIGACMCNEDTYNKKFATKHSSTFAANSLACRVGIKVLDLLSEANGRLISRVKSNGKLLKSGLLALKDKYPDILKSIRGRGLMLGIEFGIDTLNYPGSILGIMAEKELLTPVISSYLLNREYLRVAPTLNGSSVIRIEPALTISTEQCHIVLDKIRSMVKVLNERNTAKFVSFLVNEKNERIYPPFLPRYEEKITPSGEENEGQFAFLVHPLDYRNYPEFDESLSIFEENELSAFTGLWNSTCGPFVISRLNLTSKSGAKAYGEFICLMHTADDFMRMPKNQALDELKCAIDIARKGGAKIIGLGAYTSVVSMGGLYLKNEGVALTTGNSYTVVSAVDAIQHSLGKIGIPSKTTVAAVVGASGSIGKGVSILLSESVSRLVLIGNPGNRESSLERLYCTAGEIYKYLAVFLRNKRSFEPGSIGYKLSCFSGLPDWDRPLSEFIKFAKSLNSKEAPVIISTAIDEVLPLADIVVSATSSTAKIITKDNLRYGAIVCDISRPANVSEDILDARPDIIPIDGGVVEVPGLPSLGWNFGFEKGLAYACMAETMMLALERHYSHTSLGSSGVNIESILLTKKLAKKHGFKLAGLRSFNRPLSDEKWSNYMSLRKCAR